MPRTHPFSQRVLTPCCTTRLQPITPSVPPSDFLLTLLHQLEPSGNAALKHRRRIVLPAHLLQELEVLGAV